MEAWQKLMVRAVLGGAYFFGFAALVLPLAAQQTKPVQSAGFSASVSQAPSGATCGENTESNDLPDSPDVTFSGGGDTSKSQDQRQGNARELWAAAMSGPRSAGAESAQSEAPQTQESANQSIQTPSIATQTPAPPPQKPVGTAAAEAPSASGVAASQPAGVAVAPAKQRRVRTIVLRTGAIIGAGVAVGSVVALTAGTSSKPPGAH